MNWLDAVLLVVFAAYAWAGWTHGFVANLFSAGGLLVGFLLGIAIVPLIFEPRSEQISTAMFSIIVVFLAAGLGNLIGSMIGRRLRIERGPGRAVDAAMGAAFATAVVMAASWAVGYAVSATTLPYLSAGARDSTVLATVNGLMPSRAGDALRAFTDTLTGDVFPRYLEPFETEVIPDASPPDPEVLAMPAVQQARGRVVRIVGDAVCRRTIEGSGFVSSRGRVMTNAHVVAGVRDPVVSIGGRRLRAVPVLFDPRLDLAVLRVEGMDADPLRFDTGGRRGDPAAVLGFPENGPFDARAARIRGQLDLRGPDIYGEGTNSRDAFSVRALVRSGNSGGPLISPSGRVLGVIFAASVSDPDTGYAVTAGEAQPVARAGALASDRVSTGGCA